MKKNKNIFKKSTLDILRSLIIPLVFSALIFTMIVYGLRQTEASSSAEGLRILEDSLRRAVVMSYAIDGRYPENIEAIETRFGIYIDRTRYVVHYRAIGPNVLPEISVIPL